MQTLLQLGVSNLVMAGLLSLIAVVLGFIVRRPAFVHGLWLLVFLKLVTPPIFRTPIYAPETSKEKRIMWSPISAGKSSEQIENSETHRMPVVEQPSANVFLDPSTPLRIGTIGVITDQLEPSEDASTPIADAAPFQPAAINDEDSRTVVASVAVWDWRDVLGGIWLTGTAVWFAVALLRLVRFQRLLRFAKPADDAARLQAKTLADNMGVRRPSVHEMPGVLAPMVWVMGRRRLLLVPSELRSRLSRQQTATLLAHELAHLRRRDYWVRWLEMLVLGLYWWCPIVWWARNRLRQAEEECCDAWVVWTLPNLARAYACTLVETVDFLAETRSPLPIGASGFGQVQQLKRRLTMIMQGNTPRTLKLAGLVLLLGLAGLMLPLVPSFAERPSGEQEKGEPDRRIEKGDPERGEKKERGNDRERDEKKERDGDRERGEKKERDGDRERGEKKERDGGPYRGGDPYRGEKKERDGDRKRGEFGELREWAEKLERMKRELDEQRRMLEDKARMLELQFNKFREAQKRMASGKKPSPFGQPPRNRDDRPRDDRPRGDGPFAPNTPNTRVMGRLGELEKQLHRILMEIQELRKQNRPGSRPPGIERPVPKYAPRPDGERRPPSSFRPKERPRRDNEPGSVFVPRPIQPNVAPPASPAPLESIAPPVRR